MTDEKYWTRKEAANFLKTSPRQLRRWVLAGELKCIHHGGKVLFAGGELQRFAQLDHCSPTIPLPEKVQQVRKALREILKLPLSEKTRQALEFNAGVEAFTSTEEFFDSVICSLHQPDASDAARRVDAGRQKLD